MNDLKITMNIAKSKNGSKTESEAKYNFDRSGGNASSRKITQMEQNEPRKTPEINGPAGLEPTRYGDWEVKGRCSDF